MTAIELPKVEVDSNGTASAFRVGAWTLKDCKEKNRHLWGDYCCLGCGITRQQEKRSARSRSLIIA